MSRGLEIGFLLDRQWHAMRGEMEESKRPALLALAQVLADAKSSYAVIGGIALQVHQAEPRTTLDIDVAITDRDRIPRAELTKQGFHEIGRFEHSENWAGPHGTPVQFTDDPALHDAIARAESVDLGGVPLRVIGRSDLLREKLRAGTDPARRRSKRLQDLADAHALLEADASLADALTAEQRALLERLP